MGRDCSGHPLRNGSNLDVRALPTGDQGGGRLSSSHRAQTKRGETRSWVLLAICFHASSMHGRVRHSERSLVHNSNPVPPPFPTNNGKELKLSRCQLCPVCPPATCTHMRRDEKLRPAPQLTPELLLRNGWAARHGISQVSLAQSRLMLFRSEEYRDRSGDFQPQGDTSRKISTAVLPTTRRAPRSTTPPFPIDAHHHLNGATSDSRERRQTGAAPGRGKVCKLAKRRGGALPRERSVLTNNALVIYLSAVEIHGDFGAAPVRRKVNVRK